MPSTVPLETFLLTLLVPRTISDAQAAAVLKRVRSPAFRRQLRKAFASVLQTLPTPVTVSITLPN